MSSSVLEDPLYSVGRGNVGSADASPEIAHQLLRNYPDEWWSLVILGRALLNTGETVAGVRILTQAAAESPGDLTAHDTLIEYLLRRKKISEADRLCREAVQLQPWNQRAVRRALETVVRAYIR
jgi:Flp pilus assembly protein TadD